MRNLARWFRRHAPITGHKRIAPMSKGPLFWRLLVARGSFGNKIEHDGKLSCR